MTERFRSAGGWSAAELAQLAPAKIAQVLGQDPGHPLMEQFATSLRDVGERVIVDHDGCFKRAQIAAADINRTGVARLGDEDRLTAFADNLVPHVLRVDGVLRLEPALGERIDAMGELLTHGSPEEVELRAAAVHAIELLAAATRGRLSPAEIDAALWSRGRAGRYKSIPRPRSRNTAY